MEIVSNNEEVNTLLDALPYFDLLQPEGEKLANEMIENEIIAMGGKDRLMDEYLKRITIELGESGLSNPQTPPPTKLQAIDTTRYDLGKINEDKGFHKETGSFIFYIFVYD